MLKKLFVSSILVLMTLISNAGTTDTRKVKVGDEVHVYTTYHSNTQSVLWDWDPSVMELQGQLYGSSTSATFKVIASTPSSGSVIQATTYYYKDGTTSSGINKDVDVWKIYSTGNGGGGSDDDPVNPYGYVNLNYHYLQLSCGDYADLEASVNNGNTNKYSWSSSNPKVATFTTTGGKYARVFAELPGTATIRVIIDSSDYSECTIEVVEKDQVDLLEFTLNDDGTSYSVKRKEDQYPEGQLTIPSHYNGLPVTRIADNAFSFFSGLETVIIPSTVTEIGKGAFRSCHSLSRIDIPISVTKIGAFAFNNCKKLKSFTLPLNVDTIEEYTFDDCIGLTSFIIHDNVISVGSFAFAECSLIYIDIPQSVQNIEPFAFQCENLKNIYVHWSEPLMCKSIFGYQKVYDNAILYVPKGCVDLYRNSSFWSEFRNIKEGNYSGIDTITDDVCADQIDYTKPYYVYNIQGISIKLLIEQLPQGIYIIKQGDMTKKIKI